MNRYGMLCEQPPTRRWHRTGKWTWKLCEPDGDVIATGPWMSDQHEAYMAFRDLFPAVKMSPIASVWI